MTDEPFKFLVVEDHALHLKSTVDSLRIAYPHSIIRTAQNSMGAQEELNLFKPNLLVLDLQIPLQPGSKSLVQNGVNLLEQILDHQDAHGHINIAIVSENCKALVRLKDKIHNYIGGGVTATNKFSDSQILRDIKTALDGGSRINHIQELRSQQLKPKWYEVLKLAWYQCLSDKAIAKEMDYSPRNIRVFWSKIYDFFDIHGDDHDNMATDDYEIINLRVAAIQKAIERGFLDLET